MAGAIVMKSPLSIATGHFSRELQNRDDSSNIKYGDRSRTEYTVQTVTRDGLFGFCAVSVSDSDFRRGVKVQGQDMTRAVFQESILIHVYTTRGSSGTHVSRTPKAKP